MEQKRCVVQRAKLKRVKWSGVEIQPLKGTS